MTDELIFPEERIHTEVLGEYGGAKLVKIRGSKIVLKIGTETIQVDNNSIYQRFANAVSGEVLEVGLGIGAFSLLARQNPDVTSLYTVEINNDIVELFKQINGTNAKQTIQVADFKAIASGVKKKFDYILIDILFNDSRSNWNFGLQALQWTSTHLKAGGKVAFPVMQEPYGKVFHTQAMTLYNNFALIKENDSPRAQPEYVVYWGVK